MTFMQLIHRIAFSLSDNSKGEKLAYYSKQSYFSRKLKQAGKERYRFVKKNIKKKGLLNGNILDVGCGDGLGTTSLAGYGNKIYGIDKAIPHITARRDNIIFKKMDCLNLKFPADYFDAVVALEIIEHVKDYERLLDEINRVIKKDGFLILSTPNYSFTKMLLGKFHKKANKFHVKEFRTRGLHNILSKRFRQIDIYTQPSIIRKPFFIGFIHAFSALFNHPRVYRKKRNRFGMDNIFVCKDKM